MILFFISVTITTVMLSFLLEIRTITLDTKAAQSIHPQSHHFVVIKKLLNLCMGLFLEAS